MVVESTSHWEWLGDGLMEAGYRGHLANPAAMQQYSGLQYPDAHADARWLAHLLRLGVFPEGYIYPKAEQAVREVLRKRAPWVRQPTAHVLSVQNLLTRNTGARFGAKRIDEFTPSELEGGLPEAAQILAVTSRLAVLPGLRQQITTLEKTVQKRLQPPPPTCSCRPSRAAGRFWPRRSCWKRALWAASLPWATTFRPAGGWGAQKSVTASGQVRATAKMATRLSSGPLWKRPSLRSVSGQRCNGCINANRPRAT